MIHIYDEASLTRALAQDIHPELRSLLTDRAQFVLAGHTEYVVITCGVTEADVERTLGFTPLIEPIEGARFPSPNFHPHWDLLAHHDGWFELMESFGSTMGYVLLIQDVAGVWPELLTLCRQFAGGAA